MQTGTMHLLTRSSRITSLFRILQIDIGTLYKYNINKSLYCSNVDGKFNKTLPLINKGLALLQNNVNRNEDKIRFIEELVSRTPSTIQPYLKIMRVQNPIGSWLLFWPGSWSISLAAPPGMFPDPYMLFLFGVGSFVMRGAGCTINDMWDKEFDSKVERTRNRPLVNGSLTMKQAWLFLGGQLSIGLLILLQLNWYTILLGASSMVLVITYPLMKRITYWPQLVLGMTLNWGILAGYSAVKGCLDWTICLPLYTSAICWTLIYDTIYAHQDITDDIALGIKSTAIKFKENTKYWLTAFSTVMSSGLVTTGLLTDQVWPYYSAVAFISSHIAWQIFTLNIKNPMDCGNKFQTNYYVGFILFCGIVLSNLLKKQNTKEKTVDVI